MSPLHCVAVMVELESIDLRQEAAILHLNV